MMSSRARISAPVNVNRLVEVLPPSGRFDALVDMGNPMKGVILFPYLQRRVEGRALRAVAPAATLELCRTVAEAVVPRRWPREVCCRETMNVCFVLIVLIIVLRSFADRCKACGIAPRVLRAPGPANSTGRVAWP